MQLAQPSEVRDFYFHNALVGRLEMIHPWPRMFFSCTVYSQKLALGEQACPTLQQVMYANFRREGAVPGGAWRGGGRRIAPHHDLAFSFPCQLRGQSCLMMVIPLPNYDNFATKKFRSENESRSPPPPPPPPREIFFFRAGAVLSEAFPPPPKQIPWRRPLTCVISCYSTL